MPPNYNQNSVGLSDGNSSQSSAGSTQVTALNTVVSFGASEGVIIPASGPGDTYTVQNFSSSNDGLVYPPVGGSFNGETANAAITVPINKAVLIACVSPLKYSAILQLTSVSGVLDLNHTATASDDHAVAGAYIICTLVADNTWLARGWSILGAPLTIVPDAL